MYEGLVGIGFLIMLIGCAGADGSLTFAAVLIAIGAVLMLLGRKKVEEKYGQGSHVTGDHRLGDSVLHNRYKR